MGLFKSYRKQVFLVVAVLFALSYVAAARAAVHQKKSVHKTTIKVKKGKAAPVPDARSPVSLEGEVFNHIKKDDRLSEDDAARYAHIFAFQDVGDFKKANAEIKKLTDHRLMGHVLHQRYVGHDYKATY
ncbi:MAG: hypothetical protein HY052_09510, partial [Proteobacteria bacterium]|nr:hypothetical protein [Pseudomonadota bacterium]